MRNVHLNTLIFLWIIPRPWIRLNLDYALACLLDIVPPNNCNKFIKNYLNPNKQYLNRNSSPALIDSWCRHETRSHFHALRFTCPSVVSPPLDLLQIPINCDLWCIPASITSHHVEAGGSHSRLMDLHKRDWQWKFMLSAEDRVMHDRGSLYVVLLSPHSSDTVSDDLLMDISVKCFWIAVLFVWWGGCGGACLLVIVVVILSGVN